MKKITKILVFILMATSLFAFKSYAQDNTPEENYFIGKWQLKAFGLPQGDINMNITVEKKDGKLAGAVTDPTGKEKPIVFNKVEVKKQTLTVYYTAQGQDVYMTMDKKDDTNVTGSIMDMFDLTGTKEKEIEKK